MQIHFLGTSASPSMPLPFCKCPVCLEANEKRGKNLRKRSSILVNRDLLVDLGPDIMSASFEYGISLGDVRLCLQTHPHADHFDPEWIISRHQDYGSQVSQEMMVVGSERTLATIGKQIEQRCEYGSIFDAQTQAALHIELLPIKPFETHHLGDYKITGYPANHDLDQGSLLYAIEQADSALFYGTDTFLIFEEVWEHLSETHKCFDVIILDHTYGIGYEARGDHLAAVAFEKHVRRFLENRILKETGQVYATHLSHEGIMQHEKLNAYAERRNYKIAYDGLQIEVGSSALTQVSGGR